MASESSSTVRFLLLALLPYPDPLRRRRIRTAARALIRGSVWPGDSAQPLDIVELMLLRLLWLQCETHRAARARSPDAAALLARASIETCIAGLYWLYGEDKVDRMRGQNAKSFQRLLSFIVDDDLITPRLIRDVADAIGSPAELPTVREMAEVVAEKTGQPFAMSITACTCRSRPSSRTQAPRLCCDTSTRGIGSPTHRRVSGQPARPRTLRTLVWRVSRWRLRGTPVAGKISSRTTPTPTCVAR
jgi:hypothetical protein